MKKIIIALLTVVMIVCCFTLVACNDEKEQETLKNYIFEQNGTIVTEDFTLPSKIGGIDVEWKSDKSEVTLEKRADDYLARVTFPDSGEVTVKLTVTLGKVTKDFTVRVKALDVYDFMDNYKFLKDKATVVADFDLDKTCELNGKTANITWSVDTDYELYIAINEAGDKCLVTPSSKSTPVKIKATFTYNGDSASKSFSMNVYREMTSMELVDYWYTNTGVSIEMSGYVVEIGTEYSSKYKNVTLYMVNDDFTAGYYLYRVITDDDNAAKLKPGVHVTVTGTTNTNYNGLIETNAGGNLVVDTDIPEINVSEKVFAIDELVLGDLPETVYHESRLVSLTNWKVKAVEKADEIAEAANFTILTITKGGVDVNIRISKYLEGAYKPAETDATWSALCGLRETYAAGSTVNVTGIFTRYKDSWQIMPLSADAVTAGATADADDKRDYVGNKVAAAVEAVEKALLSEGLAGRITAVKEANLPTTSGEVSISYAVCGSSKAVVLDGGKMTVTPGNPENTHIMVSYVLGDFKTVSFFYVESLVPTAATMVEDLVVAEKINSVTDLPTFADATINWTVKSGSNSLAIVNNQLVPTLTEEDVTTIITAELTYKGETRTKDFIVIVKAGKGAVASVAPFEEGKEYVLASNQGNLDKTLYAVNQMDGHYMVTTENPEEAKAVKVEVVEGNYKLYFEDANAKKYIGYEVADNGKGKMQAYLALVDVDAPAWEWDTENNCFKTEITVDDKKEFYYFGTYNSFNTISLSKFSYVSTSFPAFLGTIQFVPLTANEISVDAESSDKATVTLDSTSGLNGQRFTFSVVLADGYELVSVKVNGASVTDVNGVYTGVVKGATTVKVETKQIGAADPNQPEHAGTLEDPFSAADALKVLASLDSGATYSENGVPVKVYIKGYVTVVGTVSQNGKYQSKFYIADEQGAAQDASVYVYSANFTNAVTAISMNDLVTVSGFLMDYNGTKEVSNVTIDGTRVYPELVSIEKAGKTDAEKVAEVLSALTISQSKVTEDGEITLPVSNNADVTLGWVSNHAQAVVAADNSKVTLTVSETEVVVTLTVTATCNETSDTKTFEITLVKTAPVVTDHAGTLEDPYSCADAIKILNSLATGATYSKDGKPAKIYVKGYVTVVGTVATSGTFQQKFYLADEKGSAKDASLYVYSANFTDAVSSIAMDDQVVVSGFLMDYNGTKEVSNATVDGTRVYPELVSIVKAEKTDAEKVAEVLASLKFQEKVSENGDVALPTSLIPEVVLTWASDSNQAVVAADNTKVTFTVTETEVVAKLTVTATCNEASDTRTFEVTLAVIPPQVVTVAEALVLPDDTKIIVTGVVTTVNEKWNATFGNMCVTITDAAGGQLYIYRLATNVGIGDTITVTGVMGTFSNNRQVSAGATATIDAPHVCAEWTEADCLNAPKCTLCNKDKEGASALGHIDENADNLCDRCQLNLAVETTTLNYSVADNASSFTNSAQVTNPLALDENIEFSYTGGGNTGKFYSNGNNIRIYQNENPTVTITAKDGFKIVSVTITYTNSNNGVLTLDGSNIASETLVDVNGSSVTFNVGNTGTATNGQVRITNIQVVYQAI